MAFRSLSNTSDYDVYVKQYMKILQLQAALNQRNLDANINFMKSGVQQTERADSRSIEERAVDIVKLKVQARIMLNKLTDNSNAAEVLDYLSNRGELLFFFIQQFPSIQEIVKKQFSAGIRAPLLISLIYKKYEQQLADDITPESPDFIIVSNIMTKENIQKLINETTNANLRVELESMKSVLPSKKEIDRILSDPYKNRDELQAFAEKYKSSPNLDDFNKIIESYNDAPIQSNTQDLDNAENQLIQLVNDFLNSTEGTQLISPLTADILPETKKYKSKSSLAKTIPKPPTNTPLSSLNTAERQKLAQERGQIELAKQSLFSQVVQGDVLAKKREETVNKQLLEQLSVFDVSQPITKDKKKGGRPPGSKNKIPGSKTKNPGSTKKPRITRMILPESTTSPEATTSPEPTPQEVQTGNGLMNQREQDIYRFKVLKGEIIAGNTSKVVIKEIRQLVGKLYKYNELSLEQKQAILKELNTL
jgi:hypothetical protein